MIYTLTLSPSLDYVINNENFNHKGLNRITDAKIFPGGKGINASIVLKRFGFENEAITFFHKQSLNLINNFFIKEKLNIFNIEAQEQTRINIKFSAPENHFEINGTKTKITTLMFEKLKTKLKTLNSSDFLLIMGLSDEKTLQKILKIVKQQKINFMMDIDSPNLKEYVKTYQPYLIKPNQDELTRLFNLSLKNQKEIISVLHSVQNLGAKNVIISLGAKGAYLITDQGKIFVSKIIKPLKKVISSVGAGDTLVAIFALAYQITKNPFKAFYQANAAAMGTVSQIWLTDKKLAKKYLSHISIKEIV